MGLRVGVYVCAQQKRLHLAAHAATGRSFEMLRYTFQCTAWLKYTEQRKLTLAAM